MLNKMSNFIVNKKYLVLGLMVLLTVASVFMMQHVEINEDMTKYLPDDSDMKAGIDIMADEFPEMETSSTIRVMFDDLTETQKSEIRSRLESIEYVESVTYDADSSDYNKDNHTLFVINTPYEYGSSEERAIESVLDTAFADYTMVWNNDDTSLPDIPLWVVAIALLVLMTVLFLMCSSWIEPFLFLVVIGMAIVINMGTNLILGSVSSITFSIAAILQLVLSMDYSIILMNRYRQERELTADKNLAMKAALTHAFSSVASSSLTTVVGLLMLVFMSFKIGMDLGVVLAKGVFISMICVLTMLPGVILACDKLIARTAKKCLHIPMGWAATFSYKLRHVMGILLIILFVGAYILQAQTGISYTLATEDLVAEVFPADNTLVMVYENQDEDQISDLAQKLEADDHIKSVTGYATMLAKPYTADELAEEIAAMSEDMALNPSIIQMLYYNYYTGGETGTMTASDFLYFVSDTVSGDETFSEYIDEEMLDNIDMIQKFADAEALTTPMTAEELADFFDMSASDIKDLFLFYYIENGGAPTDSMTLATFTDFVLNEVAVDPDYGSMFDEDTISQLEQLATFTDAEKMTAYYNYRGIASVLGMDADTVKLIFVYYYALSDSYDPGTMTLSDFVSFLQTDVMEDPTFSGYLDADTKAQIGTLGQFTDKTAVQAQHTPAELASMLGMDESMVKTVFILHNAQDVSGKTMTLAQFTGFLCDGLMSDPMFGGAFDEAAKTQLQTMNGLIQLAASGQALSPAQMAQVLGMDETTLVQLYYLYFSTDAGFQQEVASMTMTMQEFLVLLKAQTPEDQQGQLLQMEQLIDLSVSGKSLSSAELAAIIGMTEEEVSAIFGYQSQVTGTEITAMTLPEFLAAAVTLAPDNMQLQQLNQMVQLAASGAKLDAAVLAGIFGMETTQVQQLFGLTLAAQKAIPLSEFTNFLVNTVLANEAYAGSFTEEQKSQLITMNQLVQLAASGAGLDASTLAQTFGMEESMVIMVFRLCFGGDITGKTMSLEEMVDFILADPVMRGYLDAETLAQLQMMQTMIQATVNETSFTYEELADLLGMDSSMTRMLYTFRASGSEADRWYLSTQILINFLVNNSDTLGSAMGGDMSQLYTMRKIINGSVNGTAYTSSELAGLMGMEEDQAEQLFLLYTNRHGDTSGWQLSVKDFIDFIISNVLTNEDLADQFDAETADMLTSAQQLVDAVISGEAYTSAQMSELLSGMSEELDSNMLDLMYLYAESGENADPAWTMSMETLFHYLVEDMLKDPRFDTLIEADMREDLLAAQTELEDGKAQLVTDRYSRLIITSSYPEESAETTAFLSDLEAYCADNMEGKCYFIGNSAMTYEMQQTFDSELLFITLLTAISIFLIVALTFKSLSIPLILVLLVQCGVYITVSITGMMSGSMYYLALLIVECILMGATIDYGILLTNYYCEARKTMSVREALGAAYAGSNHTILTSGLILILVTAIVGNFFEDPTVSAIVKTVSVGALCATVLILFVLPGVLAVCDKVVIRKKKESKV